MGGAPWAKTLLKMKLIEFLDTHDPCISTDLNNLSNDIKDLDLSHNVTQLKDLRILMVNIRSMRKNFNDLCSLISETKMHFSIIMLNETWLEDREENLFKLDDYNLFCTNRNRFGGRGTNLLL